MAKKSDTVNGEDEHKQIAESSKLEDTLKALRRLREIGEKLPEADAAAIVRESRDLVGQGSR
jgi:hypothetical protein